MKSYIFISLIFISSCSATPANKKENEKKLEGTTQPTQSTQAKTTQTPDAGKPKIEKEKNMGTIDTNPLAAPSDVAAAPSNATTTPSGLSYIILRDGAGMGSPSLTAKVTAHYTGWQTDGTMFDSSVERGEPFTAPLNRLIKGWQEGMGMMTKGEKRRFWIPANLAYGDNPRPGAPAGMLVFDVELIDFTE